jgi:putative molybdopterin biosynthesis protein
MPYAAAQEPGLAPAAAYSLWSGACAAAGWRARLATESVPVRDGVGRVAGAAVRARWPSPRWACAAMDGIALRTGAVEPAGVWQLAAGEFAWVDTGDLMPPGADTVVERERVQLNQDGSALITGRAPRGLNVRTVGEDFSAGELLMPAGHRLRPADLAAAAAAGHAALEVARRPVAAIIPTGDEIRPAGTSLRPGDIIDSNSVMLAARAREAGGDALVSEVQPDDVDAVGAELRRAARAADIVLIIAGSSAGRSDHTAAVIAAAGGLAVSGVAVRPGHPVLLGYARPGSGPAGQGDAVVPVIGVPGYPLAAAVIFELFALPMLTALQGMSPLRRVWQRGQLACDWVSSPDVEDWVPVSIAAGQAGPASASPLLVTPGRRGAGSVSRLIRAHGWWPIPMGQGKFAEGDVVDILPIPGAPA